MELDKIFFTPGEVVTLRQDLPNKPLMLVKGKVTSMFKNKEGEKELKGICCIWFDSLGCLHEYIFNTKDLIKL